MNGIRILPEYALELWPYYKPYNIRSAIEISRRAEELRRKYEKILPYGASRPWSFGIPRVIRHPSYWSIMTSINEKTKFIDLGCGLGSDTRRVVKDGLKKGNVVGIDIERKFIEIGFELYEDEDIFGDNFMVCDACNTGFPDDHFDIVFSGSVIHYLSEKEKVLKYLEEAFRILKKPGGILFGRTLGNDKEVLSKSKGHRTLFIESSDSLTKYLTDIGFSHVKIKSVRIKKQPREEIKYHLYFLARIITSVYSLC